MYLPSAFSTDQCIFLFNTLLAFFRFNTLHFVIHSFLTHHFQPFLKRDHDYNISLVLLSAIALQRSMYKYTTPLPAFESVACSL